MSIKLNTASINKNKYFDNIEIALPELVEQAVWVASNIIGKPCMSADKSDPRYALINDPATWKTLSTVLEMIDSVEKDTPEYWPAIALQEGLGITIIDLDKVIDAEGKLSLSAANTVQRFDSYTEISKSGKGLHIIIKGKKPCIEDIRSKIPGIEIYDEKHFVTLTGNLYENRGEVQDRQPELEKFYFETFPPEEEGAKPSWKTSPPLTDEKVKTHFREAKNANKFKALFDEGDISAYENDDSSADMALIGWMAFYTQDKEQLTRLMRESKLKRDKWDINGTYLERTIKTALKNMKETWQPSKQGKTEPLENKNGATSWEHPERTQDIESLDVEFPLQLLPKILMDAIEEIARDTKTDPALSCHPALGITALMIGKKAYVTEKAGLRHHPSLLLIGVAPSGERKSSCFDAILEGIKEKIDNELEGYKIKKAGVRAHNEIIKDQILTVKNELKAGKIKKEQAKKCLEELIHSEQQFPPEPYNFGDDITPERLFQKLNDHEGAYGVFSSDGRNIIKKIRGNKGGESGESIYIGGMWGDDLNRSRVGNNKGDAGGEDICVRKPALTTVCFVQPDLWEEFSKNRCMRDSGLISRVCLVIPKSQMGTRIEKEDDIPRDKTKIAPFTKSVLRLRRWSPAKPIEVTLSQGAVEARREFYNAIEKELAAGGKFEDVKDIATKATSITARLALILSALIAAENDDFNGTIPPISEEIWLAAQALEEYYLAQAWGVIFLLNN